MYGLGATLYHTLTGRTPFTIETEDALEAIVSKPPPSLRSLRADVPPEIARGVHAMLAKDPAARPTAAAIADGLRDLRATHYPHYDPAPLFQTR